MKLSEALEKFCNWKAIRYEKAAKDYRRYITSFFTYVKKELDKVDNDDIVAFQRYMKEKGYSDRTRAIFSTALREFFKFSNGRGWTNIIRDEIQINKIHAKVEPYVVQHEARMLCDITQDDPIKHLAVKILWLCGPRITELVTMKKENVDLTSKGAVITNLKHDEQNSTKYIVWDDETNELIKKVMSENDSEWVFYSKKSGGHLTPRQIERWFVDFREKAGITKKITPHAARRGWVKDNLNVGLPLPHLQQAGGWKSLESLQKYTKRLDNDIHDIQMEAIRKRQALADQEGLFKKEQLKQLLREVLEEGN